MAKIKDNQYSIGSAIETFLKENKLDHKFLSNRIVSEWTRIAGPAIAKYTREIYIKDQILYLKLSSSVVKNEIMLSKNQLINILNAFCEKEYIKDVVIL